MHSVSFSLKPPPPPPRFPSSSFPKFTDAFVPPASKHPRFPNLSIRSNSNCKPNTGNYAIAKPNLSSAPVVRRRSSVAERLRCLVEEFRSLYEPIDRVKRLLQYATLLPPFDESDRVSCNRVTGCTAQVWLEVVKVNDGTMRFRVDSDSEITKGFCSCLIWLLDGAAPEEVLKVKAEDLVEMNVGLPANSRVNTWNNVLNSMQKRTKALIIVADGEEEEELLPSEHFPSLLLAASGSSIGTRGSYAAVPQAKFLTASKLKVNELVNELKKKKIGVIANLHNNPEVQSVLASARKLWPHIHISDSLVVADSASKVAKGGFQCIAVLGLNPMLDNVHVILDQAGFRKVIVNWSSTDSTAYSVGTAVSPLYTNFLEAAATSNPSLHVLYLNGSLETDTHVHQLAPTIIAIQTILQGFAQISNVNVWYGLESNMGADITGLFQQMVTVTDEEFGIPTPRLH